MKPDSKLLRILDANFNRSREGLRVCEEIFRFFLNDSPLTRKLKKTRHQITGLLKSMPVAQSEILAARDVGRDEGRKPSFLEKKRAGILDLFLANIERTKEALRVLEEFTKFLDARTSIQFKKLRFEVYTIEKRALPKLEALCDHRPGRRKKAAGGKGA